MSIKASIKAFFLTPASPKPIAALRIGVAVVLLIQAFLLRRDVLTLFASDGLVQDGLARFMATPNVPSFRWVTDILTQYGVSEAFAIQGICSVYVLSLVFLAIGLFTRTATISAWLLHWMLMNTADTTNYGADLYAHVFLYYLMFAPAAGAWSVDAWLKRVSTAPSIPARLMLRVMQLHLCIAYLASAIEKGSGEQWWNGELLWRALSLPVYQQFDMTWLAHWIWLSKIAGWATLLVEGGYFIFIWPRQTRRLWVAAVVGLHAGIIVFLGLGVFGTIMCVMTAALFGISAEVSAREPVSTGLNLDEVAQAASI